MTEGSSNNNNNKNKENVQKPSDPNLAESSDVKMTTKRRYSSDIARREEEHLRLLEELDSLPLTDSCCEICHCDCYNSHRSTDSVEQIIKNVSKRKSIGKGIAADSNNNNNHKSAEKRKSNGTTQTTSNKGKVRKKRERTRSKSPCSELRPKQKVTLKRSKSAGSLNSSQPVQLPHPTDGVGGGFSRSHFTRDCEILQDLLKSLDTPRLEITGNKRPAATEQMMSKYSKSTLELPTTSKAAARDSTWKTPKICESMANLCLTPAIREAYQQVPMHDKKILNRMANKRSEKVVAKENAWLARKFWENERYERELFKCEQMEEYKRAVRDKQFQDYLLTKERLNELAQRDYQELQRLRQTLAHKDALTKKRLATIRVERDISLCQRRCEELRKSEAVNLHQEERHLGDVMRKQEICSRLTERLRRADEIRNQMLEGYLKRLRYDNYLQQLVHEEHWREAQELESLKRAQLKEHIDAKSKDTQRFIEQRQRRMEAMTKTAKISASLRQLVRSSVTPEGALVTTSYATSTANLGKLLFDRPISKLSNKC